MDINSKTTEGIINDEKSTSDIQKTVNSVNAESPVFNMTVPKKNKAKKHLVDIESAKPVSEKKSIIKIQEIIESKSLQDLKPKRRYRDLLNENLMKSRTFSQGLKWKPILGYQRSSYDDNITKDNSGFDIRGLDNTKKSRRQKQTSLIVTKKDSLDIDEAEKEINDSDLIRQIPCRANTKKSRSKRASNKVSCDAPTNQVKSSGQCRMSSHNSFFSDQGKNNGGIS